MKFTALPNRFVVGYPTAQLDLLPDGQQKAGVGYIADAERFKKVWQAWQPEEDVPTVDFKTQIVVFLRNLKYYNQIGVTNASLKDGTLKLGISRTTSSAPVDEKTFMKMIVIPRKGVQQIQADQGDGSQEVTVKEKKE